MTVIPASGALHRPQHKQQGLVLYQVKLVPGTNPQPQSTPTARCLKGMVVSTSVAYRKRRVVLNHRAVSRKQLCPGQPATRLTCLTATIPQAQLVSPFDLHDSVTTCTVDGHGIMVHTIPYVPHDNHVHLWSFGAFGKVDEPEPVVSSGRLRPSV